MRMRHIASFIFLFIFTVLPPFSPAEARFLQADPIGYEDQMNLYAYVGNDPVNMSDPTGMYETTCRVKDGEFLGCDPITNDNDEKNITVTYEITYSVHVNGEVVDEQTTVFNRTYGSPGSRSTIKAIERQIGNFTRTKIRLAIAEPDKRPDSRNQAVAKATPKARATDIPSWAKGTRPRSGQSGREYAREQMDRQYGKGKWEGDPKREKEFRKLQKWGDRGGKS